MLIIKKKKKRVWGGNKDDVKRASEGKERGISFGHSDQGSSQWDPESEIETWKLRRIQPQGEPGNDAEDGRNPQDREELGGRAVSMEVAWPYMKPWEQSERSSTWSPQGSKQNLTVSPHLMSWLIWCAVSQVWQERILLLQPRMKSCNLLLSPVTQRQISVALEGQSGLAHPPGWCEKAVGRRQDELKGRGPGTHSQEPGRRADLTGF